MAVEKAIAMGKARCRVVQWEYIEDSIFTKSGKPRVISANFHEIQSVLRRQRRFAEAREIYKKKFVEEGNMSKALADPGMWVPLFRFWSCWDLVGVLGWWVIGGRDVGISGEEKGEREFWIGLMR